MRYLLWFRILSVVILVVGLSIFAAGQNRLTVDGYVRDTANGEGLIGAAVYVREAKTGVNTNAYGYYSLSLPSGKYTLVFTYLGYKSTEKIINLQSPQHLNVEMIDDSRQLQEVTVTAQKEGDHVKSTEMSVNKIDISTLRKMPALLGEVDLIKSIQLLPGVTSVGEGTSGFNVRGGDVSQNLVLLDEAPVFNSSHLFGLFSVFNPDAVKDVKLIKGGIPAQYGGRISSILDVRMKEGNSRKTELRGGIGTIFSRISYEQPFARGKGSFIVAGRRSYIDVLAKPFLNRDLRDSKFYFYDLTAKANYRLSEKNTFFASGYFGRDVFNGGGFGFDWGNATGTARWNHVFSNKLFLNLTAFYSNYAYQIGVDDEDAPDAFNWSSRIINRSLKPDFTFYLNPNNQITFGGQYIHYNFRPARAVFVSDGERSDISLEPRFGDESVLYISNEQTITSWLSLHYGIHYSYFRNRGPGTAFQYYEEERGERQYPVFPGKKFEKGTTIAKYGNWEPRISANIGLGNLISIKLSYNRMAQYLHLLSNTAANSPLDMWTLSSNNVKPEIADQWALGWFQNFGDNAYEFSVETYYKQMRNQINYVPSSELLLNPFFEGDLLFGDGRAYGAEFFLKKNIGKLNGWISYTLSRTERHDLSINRGAWFPARFDKPHNLSLVAIYDVKPRLSFSANFTFMSGTPATFPTNRFVWNGNWALPYNYLDARNNNRIPSYHRLDLAATLKARKRLFGRGQSEWVFSIYNVYNRRNPFSIYTQVNEDNPNKTEAVQYAIIGSIVPAVSYNFSF